MNKRLPLGLLAVLLIVLLAGVGVAYGLWSETLTIDGTVNTGEVDVGFSGPYVTEWVDVNGYPKWEPREKDQYAECTAEATDLDPNSDGKEGITIKVDGAYPSYHCAVQFDISNLGTVPVHITKPYVPEDDEETPSWVTVRACYPQWYQLHPNSSAWAWILIHFTNNDNVNENGEYEFTFRIDALQWNEAPATVDTLADSGCYTLPEITD